MRLLLIGAAAAAVLSVSAQAQIATVVPPPGVRARERAAAVAAERREQATRDSVTRVAVVDMRAWVDSAAQALASGVDSSGADSVAAPAAEPGATPARDTSAARPRAASREGGNTVEFREGAPAPATATPYPMLALAGGGLIVAGLALRRRARQ